MMLALLYLAIATAAHALIALVLMLALMLSIALGFAIIFGLAAAGL